MTYGTVHTLKAKNWKVSLLACFPQSPRQFPQLFPSSLRAELRGLEIKDLAGLQDWRGWGSHLHWMPGQLVSSNTLVRSPSRGAEEFRASFLMIRVAFRADFFPPGLTFSPVIKPSNKTVSFCNGQATEKRLLGEVSNYHWEGGLCSQAAG